MGCAGVVGSVCGPGRGGDVTATNPGVTVTMRGVVGAVT